MVQDGLSVAIFADDPALLEVARYWSGKRKGRMLPGRADIDPLELSPGVWPNLLLTEPVPESAAMRYRLVGSAHVERYTFDFTGKTTAEIMQGSYRDYMERIYRTCLDQAAPVYSESVFRWDDADYAHGHASTRRLMLPISLGDPDRAAQILSVQVWPMRMRGPRSVAELSRNSDYRDGAFTLLDRDSFQPMQRDRAAPR